jgi:hypothetical protein
MAKSRQTSAEKSTFIEVEAGKLMMDTAVDWLRRIHGSSSSAMLSMEPSDRRRVGNLATDLAERGIEVWRGLLDLQRRYDPELISLAGGGTFRAANAGEELAVTKGAVFADLKKTGNTYTCELQFSLANRSRTYADIVLPRAVLLVRADEGDRLLCEVKAAPSAPVLGPGEQLQIKLTLTAHSAPAADLNPPSRYHTVLAIRSRGPWAVDLPVEITYSGASPQPDAQPDPNSAAPATAE